MVPLQYMKSQDEINVLLHNWEKFCEEQSKMHSISVSFFRTINYMIAIPAILLSTFSGAGSIGLASNCDSDSLSIALGFLVLISGAMFSVHRYMNIPELQQMHDFYGDEFYKLSNSIRLNLVLSEDESRSFKNIQEYAKFIKSQIDICVDKAPGIPRHVLQKVKKQLGGELTIMSKCGDTENHSDITHNPPLPQHFREIKRCAEMETLHVSHAMQQLPIDSREQSRTNIHPNVLFMQEDKPRPRKESSSKSCMNPDTIPS
jgi:hypothetical protein